LEIFPKAVAVDMIAQFGEFDVENMRGSGEAITGLALEDIAGDQFEEHGRLLSHTKSNILPHPGAGYKLFAHYLALMTLRFRPGVFCVKRLSNQGVR
jgi:hypothetical protein